ncbi:MAG: hypothetical protein FJZ97_03295 [Chloroflexi bacterium]|nr:hypothetical protein [Chloroflexota bacterium]
MPSRAGFSLALIAGMSMACSLLGRSAGSEPPLTPIVVETASATPSAPVATEPASLPTLYLPYTSGGRQAWQLGPGAPLQVDLPVEVGSFYGFSPLTNRMLYAAAFSDHGAGPDNIAVSDLAIYDLAAGTSETLFSDDVVEALWAPNGADLAYILATAQTYELRWRSESGEDRLLARDVTFNWSIAPSGEAVAFTRESRYSLTQDPGLFIVRVADGVEIKVSDSDAQGYGSVSDQPLWSPDSRWVALPLWATPDPRLSLTHADGSGSLQLTIDPADAGEWWATAAIPNFLWYPDRDRLVAAPATSQGEMGGPSPLVVYDLDLDRGLLENGRMLAEITALIGWDVPGRSVWVLSFEGVPERVVLP